MKSLESKACVHTTLNISDHSHSPALYTNLKTFLSHAEKAGSLFTYLHYLKSSISSCFIVYMTDCYRPGICMYHSAVQKLRTEQHKAPISTWHSFDFWIQCGAYRPGLHWLWCGVLMVWGRLDTNLSSPPPTPSGQTSPLTKTVVHSKVWLLSSALFFFLFAFRVFNYLYLTQVGCLNSTTCLSYSIFSTSFY